MRRPPGAILKVPETETATKEWQATAKFETELEIAVTTETFDRSWSGNGISGSYHRSSVLDGGKYRRFEASDDESSMLFSTAPTQHLHVARNGNFVRQFMFPLGAEELEAFYTLLKPMRKLEIVPADGDVFDLPTHEDEVYDGLESTVQSLPGQP